MLFSSNRVIIDPIILFVLIGLVIAAYQIHPVLPFIWPGIRVCSDIYEMIAAK